MINRLSFFPFQFSSHEICFQDNVRPAVIVVTPYPAVPALIRMAKVPDPAALPKDASKLRQHNA
jgi:hypothetical protein